jgi:tRNA (mo5U34)-methyltransferase
MNEDVNKQVEGPTQAEVDSLQPWWHTFTFPNGVKTKGVKGGPNGEEVLRREAEEVFKYPVLGKTVLDVGAWNGYFSVEAVRRGAKRTVALDKNVWTNPARQDFKGFELVRRYLAPEIEAVTRDVMDLRSDPVGSFDCVLFLGVLYHLRHPFYVLETLFHLTLEHLVVETAIDLINYDRPAMVFYPGAEADGDPSNWWGPNPQCVIDMLKTVGFSRVEHTPHPLAKTKRAFFHAFK